MRKRLLDIVGSSCGLVIASPVLLAAMFMIWWEDKHSPFYIAWRVGQHGRPFQMVKLRSMIVNADSSGVDSTGANDRRITRVGHLVRQFKLDELTQLWHVLRGEMSLVGPRPNVKRETDLYTPAERMLLSVKPGVTDFASIVFSDEGDILKDQPDPDIAYNQLIRPGKSRLGLFYIDHCSVWVDIQICCLTAIAIVSRPHALAGVQRLLERLGAPPELIQIAGRSAPLTPMPPPGADRVVVSRELMTPSNPEAHARSRVRVGVGSPTMRVT
jgi:lipopolysaccharide/colanic/teichoic acid biosynthesis glycosyltransferase